MIFETKSNTSWPSRRRCQQIYLDGTGKRRELELEAVGSVGPTSGSKMQYQPKAGPDLGSRHCGVRALTRGKKGSGGRNSQGRITAFHRGGGNKKLYRIIDFKRSL